jgi:membrane protein required for colicin V production
MIGGINTLDVVLMVITLISILFGVLKGFIRELLSLAFFIVAVVLSFLFYRDVGDFFLAGVKNRDVANFAGFAAIFTVVLIIGAVVTYLVKKIFTIGPLKAIDRILGGVFGLVRGMLISAIIVFALVAFPVNDNLVTESRLSPYVVSTVGVLFNLLPQKYKEKLKILKTGDVEK